MEKNNYLFFTGTVHLHELLSLLPEEKPSIDCILEDHASSDAFWAIINASHWSLTKKIDDQNARMLIQHLLENEIIYSRKLEMDSFAEGLDVLGLLEIIRKNPGSCCDWLCYNTKMTAEKFFLQMVLKEPTDFCEKQSYLWFLKYVESSDEEQLIRLLQFVSAHKSIPPS